MAWGVEMAQLGTEVTGHEVGFLADAYGTFGQVTWITVIPDMAAADAASEAVMSSEAYLSKVADASDLFVPGSAQALLSRVA